MKTRQFRIQEIRTDFDPSLGILKSADLLPTGQYAAVFQGQDGLVLHFGPDVEVPITDTIDFPIISLLDPETAVIVDSRTGPGKDNGWVIRRDGSQEAKFCAGDGIQDLLARNDRIVITYFDEGIFGSWPLSQQGLAVLSRTGELVFGYWGDVPNPIEISDCVCVCWRGPSETCFLPDVDFQLVCLNLETRQQQIWKLPEELNGSRALVPSGDGWYFFGPYNDNEAIFWWRPGSGPEIVGRCTSPSLRGLWNGRFLRVEDHAFVVMQIERC